MYATLGELSVGKWSRHVFGCAVWTYNTFLFWRVVEEIILYLLIFILLLFDKADVRQA